MKALIALAALAVPLALAGCDFDTCEVSSIAPAPIRNPDTGLCETFATPASCGDGDTLLEPAPLPAWGQCFGECEGLGVDSCMAADDCQAVFVGSYPEDTSAFDNAAFFECWATAPNYDVNSGACSDLGAQQCSERSDCIKYHYESGAAVPSPAGDGDGFVGPTVGPFAFCGAEPTVQGCYSDDDCGQGSSCTAETECLPPPGCDEGAVCPDVCYGTCVPDNDPGECGVATCEMVAPSCPDGTVPGVKNDCYTGACIPESSCDGGGGPGLCYEPHNCDDDAPACPQETLPGINNGCYTGYCIPVAACELELTCSDQQSEGACVSRADCSPLYAGENCTCDAAGCTCDTWVYSECN